MSHAPSASEPRPPPLPQPPCSQPPPPPLTSWAEEVPEAAATKKTTKKADTPQPTAPHAPTVDPDGNKKSSRRGGRSKKHAGQPKTEASPTTTVTDLLRAAKRVVTVVTPPQNAPAVAAAPRKSQLATAEAQKKTKKKKEDQTQSAAAAAEPPAADDTSRPGASTVKPQAMPPEPKKPVTVVAPVGAATADDGAESQPPHPPVPPSLPWEAQRNGASDSDVAARYRALFHEAAAAPHNAYAAAAPAQFASHAQQSGYCLPDFAHSHAAGTVAAPLPGGAPCAVPPGLAVLPQPPGGNAAAAAAAVRHGQLPHFDTPLGDALGRLTVHDVQRRLDVTAYDDRLATFAALAHAMGVSHHLLPPSPPQQRPPQPPKRTASRRHDSTAAGPHEQGGQPSPPCFRISGRAVACSNADPELGGHPLTPSRPLVDAIVPSGQPQHGTANDGTVKLYRVFLDEAPPARAPKGMYGAHPWHLMPAACRLAVNGDELKRLHRPADVKVGGIRSDVGVIPLVNFLEFVSGVTVVGTDLFNATFNRLTLWLENGAADVPKLIAAVHHRAWMAPHHERCVLVARDHDSLVFLSWFLHALNSVKDEKVFYPRHLITVEKWHASPADAVMDNAVAAAGAGAADAPIP